MKKMLVLALVSLVTVCGETVKTNSLPADPEKAWKEIEASFKAPPIPKDWSPQGPTEEQRLEFEKFLGKRSFEVAEKAREFYTRFPDDANAEKAKASEKQFTEQAIRYGNKEATERADASLTEEERVHRKILAVQKRAMDQESKGVSEVLKTFEDGVREVVEEYPKSPLPWQALLSIANYADKETQKRLLNEIAQAKSADEETIARAKGILKATDAIGRPLELSYTAIDGRKIDVQKLKGKVVLVDFWATWCPPCMAALPDVVEVYKKYHDKGFEIVGISLDKSKPALEKVLERYKMTWPQYFDGLGWGNKFVIEYNISAVPTMWLVDKAGKLRATEVREDLETQVRDLLAEKL